MSTKGSPIADLLTVLTEQGLDAVSSTNLGAGALLGMADLEEVTCAVAVLPEPTGDIRPVPPGLAAILVEIGIAVGRGIPTLIIIDPDRPLPPALATMPYAGVALDNLETLRLHVRVFARTAIEATQPSLHRPDLDQPGPKLDLAAERQRLREILDTPGPTSLMFEQFVVDLLSRVGGQVESHVRVEDEGIDAVIGLGGRHGPPLVILVEVKRLRRSPAGLAEAGNQLLRYLAIRRADLGLIVVDKPITDAARGALPPMILALSADELLDHLAKDPLDRILRRARNRAVHGV